MMRPSKTILPGMIIALLLVASILGPTVQRARADEPPKIRLATANEPVAASDAFQVTIEISEVLEGQADQPQDRHLVLFKDGKAYDFALTKPHDVTVVDPAGGQIVLLSRDQHVKSTIPNQDIVTAAAKFRVFAINEKMETRLGLDAQVFPPTGANSNYKIGFGPYHYEANAVAPTLPMQPARFAEFTDWVARVNLIRRLGTPPFARITLGQAIAADGLVPATLTLQIKSDRHSRTFRSLYTFKNELSTDAAKRLDEVAGMMTLYREVAPEAFPR